jgi:pimeloyl-ACP methyl ester carboxylesterase
MTALVGLPAGRMAALARTDVPKAVVFGAHDTEFSASAPTVIAGARHLSLISHPDQVAAAITALPALRRA